MAQAPMKGEWKFATMWSMEQSVMTFGMNLRPESSVDNWDTCLEVRVCLYNSIRSTDIKDIMYLRL